MKKLTPQDADYKRQLEQEAIKQASKGNKLGASLLWKMVKEYE